MRASAVGILLVFGLLPCAGQNRREPDTFFRQYVGLNDEQIADIEHGKPVTKILSTPTPGEVAVFGAVFVNASPDQYLKAAQNIDDLRKSKSYLGVRQFSTPPKLSDLDGFALDDDDINDLKNCKPGDCELQLPAESMDQFKRSINWSGNDVAAQVNGLAQKMALQLLINYQKDGNSALGDYYDKEHPLHVTEQFKSLLGESSSLSNYLPDLKRYLVDYPHAGLANASSIFYWEKVKFGLKPTLRMNQMVLFRGPGTSGPLEAVAIKQLYASHYFQTAMDLTVCAKDSSRPNENSFFLITVKGSRQAGLTGAKGSLIRKKAVSGTRSSLEAALINIKNTLESGH